MMDSRRIALVFLLFFTFYVEGKPTKTPAVTFPVSGITTPGPGSAGGINIMYRLVPLFIFLLVAAVIFFYWYRAWRQREQKQANDLKMVRVEKPVVQKPAVQLKKKNIKPAIDNIKEATTIIERLKAAKREEKKLKKKTSKAEEKKMMTITPKTEEENITKRASRLKRFRKWILKSTRKKNKRKEN